MIKSKTKYFKTALFILLILISFIVGFRSNDLIRLRKLEEYFYYGLLDSASSLNEYNDGIDDKGKLKAASILDRCYYISTEIMGLEKSGEMLNQVSDLLIIKENISEEQHRKIKNLLESLGNRNDELNSWMEMGNLIREIEYNNQE